MKKVKKKKSTLDHRSTTAPKRGEYKCGKCGYFPKKAKHNCDEERVHCCTNCSPLPADTPYPHLVQALVFVGTAVSASRCHVSHQVQARGSLCFTWNAHVHCIMLALQLKRGGATVAKYSNTTSIASPSDSVHSQNGMDGVFPHDLSPHEMGGIGPMTSPSHGSAMDYNTDSLNWS